MRGYSILAAIVYKVLLQNFCATMSTASSRHQTLYGEMSPCSNYDSSWQNAIETLKSYYTRYERVVCEDNGAYYVHGIVASAAMDIL